MCRAGGYAGKSEETARAEGVFRRFGPSEGSRFSEVTPGTRVAWVGMQDPLRIRGKGHPARITRRHAVPPEAWAEPRSPTTSVPAHRISPRGPNRGCPFSPDDDVLPAIARTLPPGNLDFRSLSEAPRPGAASARRRCPHRRDRGAPRGRPRALVRGFRDALPQPIPSSTSNPGYPHDADRSAVIIPDIAATGRRSVRRLIPPGGRPHGSSASCRIAGVTSPGPTWNRRWTKAPRRRDTRSTRWPPSSLTTG